MAAAFEVIDSTGAGKAKVRYTGIDQTGYRDLEADEPIPQQSYAASKGNEQRVIVRDRDTGQMVTRAKESDVIEVTGSAEAGERGATQTNPTFEIEVTGTQQAREILQERRDQWEAWQLYGLWYFKCKESGGGDGYVNGWSKVHDEIKQNSFRRPVVDHEYADDGEPIQSELAGFETVEGDTVDVAFQEASDHAWSKMTCSVLAFHNEQLELKLYAPVQSDWADQAQQYSHIRVNGDN